MPANPITYQTGQTITSAAFIELLKASTLGERRPIHNHRVMQVMLKKADLLVTAWDDTRLVGLSRSLTDFAYVAYVADLAVHQAYQRNGIGKELIQRTREALEPTCTLILLSAPKANGYYPKLGFEHNPRAWTLGPQEKP